MQFYGTTGGGGVNYDGTVFKMTPRGKETVLNSFGGGSDGNIPEGGLIMDGQGNLYGTTQYGGSAGNGVYGCGTVFKLTPKGAETVLHAFANGSDGAFPQASLVLDKKGSLYGTTGQRDANNDGIVFEVRNWRPTSASGQGSAVFAHPLSQRFILRDSAVCVLEIAPPCVSTKLMNSQDAMALEQFIEETICGAPDRRRRDSD